MTVLEEGGHIAEVFHKKTGVSPLWLPHWRSLEPSQFDPAKHREFGSGADGRLLAGIMGHNLCLDIFGGPSDAEAAAGLTAHGEASVTRYAISTGSDELVMQARLPLASLDIRRKLVLRGDTIHIQEQVHNLTACDRPIGWTQHVTLAPPFLRHGETEVHTSATRSKVFELEFGPADYLSAGAVFDWPHAPASDGSTVDLRVYSARSSSSAYTAHLNDPSRPNAFFVAFTRTFGLAFGYQWKQADFPWLGIWEENRSRAYAPWNRQAVTRGMEFGVSPFPETRRQMIDRGSMFGVPTFRWIPAGHTVTVDYMVVARAVTSVHQPEVLFSND